MKDTQHIRRFFLSPESCPRGGTWGYLGAKIKFRPAVCPLCYLLLNHWTKLNQICYVSYSHQWGAQRKIIFWPRLLVPWRGVKRSNIISITKSIIKIFTPNFVCVLTNERYKAYQTGFSSCSLDNARGGTLGRWGCPGGQNIISNMVMWHIKSTRMTSRTECK